VYHIERYRGYLTRHGASGAALGWGPDAKQDLRFAALTAEVLARPTSSVLDVGCGFADLYPFLRARGWRGQYTGVDLVPEFVQIARQRHGNIQLVAGEPTALRGSWDFVIGCGIFNARLSAGDHLGYVRATLRTCFDLARLAVCVDFLSDRADYQSERASHADPLAVLELGLALSPRVVLAHDYLPHEFKLLVVKDVAQQPGRRAYSHGYAVRPGPVEP
jgi:SAM-dependent methyltransferase